MFSVFIISISIEKKDMSVKSLSRFYFCFSVIIVIYFGYYIIHHSIHFIIIFMLKHVVLLQKIIFISNEKRYILYNLSKRNLYIFRNVKGYVTDAQGIKKNRDKSKNYKNYV